MLRLFAYSCTPCNQLSELPFQLHGRPVPAPVRLEQWIDENSNNSWHRVLRYTDSGDWGGGYPNCGGPDTQVITWGGPIAIFRWDNIDDIDVKYFSIREIKPPK